MLYACRLATASANKSVTVIRTERVIGLRNDPVMDTVLRRLGLHGQPVDWTGCENADPGSA